MVIHTTAANNLRTYFAMAQRSDIQGTNANMTSAMVELARLHLSDADKALNSWQYHKSKRTVDFGSIANIYDGYENYDEVKSDTGNGVYERHDCGRWNDKPQ